MKRGWVWLLPFVVGCSNSPVTGLMDRLAPSRVQPLYADDASEPKNGPAPPAVLPTERDPTRLEEPLRPTFPEIQTPRN